MDAPDMPITAYAKKLSTRYFSERNGMLAQRGNVKVRPKVERPNFHRYSETVPTGPIQLQKDFRKTNEITMNEQKRKKPATCT